MTRQTVIDRVVLALRVTVDFTNREEREVRAALSDLFDQYDSPPRGSVTCPDHPDYSGSIRPAPTAGEPQGCVGCWRVFCSLPSCRGPGVGA